MITAGETATKNGGVEQCCINGLRMWWRGTDGGIYPWGNDLPTDELAVFGVRPQHWGGPRSFSRVDSHAKGASPYGAHHMAGNVFEWVEDCWNTSHKNAPKNGTARIEGNCKYRVLRGGSFYYYSKVAKSFYRAKNPPGVKNYWLGFRVLRELD